jgi:predicted phosphodiesterase
MFLRQGNRQSVSLDGMDEALDRLLEPVESDPIPNPSAKPKSAQWLPGVVWDGSEGTVTTNAIPIEESPDWDSVLRIWGLDPANFSVVEPVLFNAWGNPEGVLNRQWKAKVVRKGTVKEQADISDLVDEIKKHKKQPQPQYVGDGVFCVVLADWQMGKPDGDGLKGTAKRILDGIDAVENRVKELRRIKRPLGRLIVLWTGDSVEGCIGHYEQQVFGVELDRRDQVKIARRLLRDALIRWAKLFDDVSVVAVAGNHGENRNSSGKSYTSLNDNDDVAIVEQVAEILGSNSEAYGHVKFAIPKDKLSITVEAAGWILGITHGHIAKVSGASPELKIKKWLEGQSFGRQPMGDADVVVTGHWHHLRAADWGGVMWLQAPALDGGSLWWKEMSGASAETGILTFCMYPERRVADMAVL